MWNSTLSYNEEKMYIPKDELLQNIKWVTKLNSMIESDKQCLLNCICNDEINLYV